MKPTRSAKSTETSRRSAAGEASGADGVGAPAGGGDAPHSPQNAGLGEQRLGIDCPTCSTSSWPCSSSVTASQKVSASSRKIESRPCERRLVAGQLRPEPMRVGLEKRWPLAGTQGVDVLEKLAHFLGVSEREGPRAPRRAQLDRDEADAKRAVL